MTVEIYANNTKIPLSEELSVRFYNPLFNDLGSYSFPLRINATNAVIQKAFGWPGLMGADNGMTVPGRVRIDNIHLTGNWKIFEVSDTMIEASFIPNQGTFYTEIKGRYLDEFEYSGETYPVGALASVEDVLAYLDDFMDTSYPESDFAVYSAYMPNAYDMGLADDDTKFVNPVTQDATPALTAPDTPGALNSTIYVFVGAVIDYILNELGYRVGYNIFREDNRFRTLTIFNIFNRARSIQKFDLAELVPHVTVGDFFRALRERFGIALLIDESSKTAYIRSFVQISQQAPRDVPGTPYGTWDKNRLAGIELPLAAPDEWMDHEFGGVADFLPFVPTTVNKVRDIAAGPSTLGNVYYVRSESAYYKVELSEGVYSAARKCVNNFPFLQGNNHTEKEQLSSHLAQHTFVKTYEYEILDEFGDPVEMTTYVDYVVPRCDLQGTGVGTPKIDYPLMFCFARGIEPAHVVPEEGGPSGWAYPLGSFDIYNAEGSAVTGATLALRWAGTYGLVESLLGDLIEWELERKALRVILLEGIAKLDHFLDFSTPIYYGKDKALVDSFTLVVTNKTAFIQELRLYRM